MLKEKLYKICQRKASLLLFQQNVIAKVFSSVNIWTEKQIKKEEKEREIERRKTERLRNERKRQKEENRETKKERRERDREKKIGRLRKEEKDRE